MLGLALGLIFRFFLGSGLPLGDRLKDTSGVALSDAQGDPLYDVP